MASSLGPSLPRRNVAVLVKWGIGTTGMILLSLSAVIFLCWSMMYLAFSPSLGKTEIGSVELKNGQELSLGWAHDGDISYQYYVRVKGANEALQEWAYVDWHIKQIQHCDTAVSPDGRFAAVAFEGSQGTKIVLYDSQEQELWWERHDQWLSMPKFLRAWKTLHASHPNLPAPPPDGEIIDLDEMPLPSYKLTLPPEGQQIPHHGL